MSQPQTSELLEYPVASVSTPWQVTINSTQTVSTVVTAVATVVMAYVAWRNRDR